MKAEGTDAYPEWNMEHGIMYRTPNNTLMLCLPGENALVLEIIDRFDNRIYPDPEGTAAVQKRINDQLDQEMGYPFA